MVFYAQSTSAVISERFVLGDGCTSHETVRRQLLSENVVVMKVYIINVIKV